MPADAHASRATGREDVGVVRPLLSLATGHRHVLALTVLLGIVASLAEGIGITLFLPLLQVANEQATGSEIVAENSISRRFDSLLDGFAVDDRLLVVCGLILALAVARALFQFLSRAAFAFLEARVGHELRMRCFALLLDVDLGYIQRADPGELINALDDETWDTTDALSALVQLIVESMTIVFYLTLMVLVSWKQTLFIALSMGGIFVVVRLLTLRIGSMSKQLASLNGEMVTRELEGLNGAKVIRQYGREQTILDRFHGVSTRVAAIDRRIAMIRAGLQPSYELLAGALLVTVVFTTVRNDPAGFAAMLLFIVVLFRMVPALRRTDSARVGLLAETGAVQSVARLLDRTDKPFTPNGTVDSTDLEPAFRFDHVTFAYERDAPAIVDVCAEFGAGRTTALVGPSGAGKSTIVDLLGRYWVPDEGSITFGGADLRELDIVTLRSRMAVVSQEIFLFSATVAENIAFGVDVNHPGAIEEAARLANAHDFIAELPDGYETFVGDDGVRLSGGQRQRIALARAIMRDPDVLILDEATNALDSISERLIQDAIDVLSRDRTVIVVAHRLATVRDADHIIVMDHGRVVEQGTPSELRAGDGLYAELDRLQQTTP